MYKSIISILFVLSVAMLSCLDDELRMASVYRADEPEAVEQLPPTKSPSLIQDSIPFESSILQLTETSTEKVSQDKSELKEPNSPEDDLTKVVDNKTKNKTVNKVFPAEGNPSEMENTSQENYSYKRVKSTKQDPELFLYKSSVLMRLSASNSTAASIEQPPVEEEELMNQNSNDENAIQEEDNTSFLSDDDLTKILDEAPELNNESLEISKPFNFNLQKNKAVTVNSLDDKGQPIAHARFTIENSSGNIIKEGNTNEQGKYSTQLSQFSNSPIYVRFHTIGMNPERVLINEQGGL